MVIIYTNLFIFIIYVYIPQPRSGGGRCIVIVNYKIFILYIYLNRINIYILYIRVIVVCVESPTIRWGYTESSPPYRHEFISQQVET